MGRAPAIAAALLATVGAGGCTGELPARGEVILVVDTDLPVPQLASALRLDLYSIDESEGLRWYESRTIALPDPRDWPVSFSIYNPPDRQERSALVRLRVYPRGRERDYHGERFLPPPPEDLPPDQPYRPPEAGQPLRLMDRGRDVTPPTEPSPNLTVDRLFRLRLVEGEVGRARIELQGACVGTMADLEGRRSCVSQEKMLEPMEELGAEPASGFVAASQQGSFAPRSGCSRPARPPTEMPGTGPYHDDEVCVPGGAFIFGNVEAFGIDKASGVPERVAVLPSFFIDRYEVTVRRMRRAFAEGFVSPDGSPYPNPGSFNTQLGPESPSYCTYTPTPGPREDYPVNCVSYETARAFCDFYGGDLPTEAQWEYVAQAAGRGAETPYPWGHQEPRCDQVVYARVSAGLAAFTGGNQCVQVSVGPAPVTEIGAEPGDVSLGLGVFALGGSLQEHMRDDFLPLDTVFWAAAPIWSPECQYEDPTSHSARGGTWAAPSSLVYPGLRVESQLGVGMLIASSTSLGFRCVWPDAL